MTKVVLTKKKKIKSELQTFSRWYKDTGTAYFNVI